MNTITSLKQYVASHPQHNAEFVAQFKESGQGALQKVVESFESANFKDALPGLRDFRDAATLALAQVKGGIKQGAAEQLVADMNNGLVDGPTRTSVWHDLNGPLPQRGLDEKGRMQFLPAKFVSAKKVSERVNPEEAVLHQAGKADPVGLTKLVDGLNTLVANLTAFTAGQAIGVAVAKASESTGHAELHGSSSAQGSHGLFWGQFSENGSVSGTSDSSTAPVLITTAALIDQLANQLEGAHLEPALVGHIVGESTVHYTHGFWDRDVRFSLDGLDDPYGYTHLVHERPIQDFEIAGQRLELSAST